jgi:hypothetical protein
MTTPTFTTDIRPYFSQYLGQMRWRFDLTDYDQVKANAAMIYDRIQSKSMPPPPFPPFPDMLSTNFKTWMDNGFPE